MKLLLINNSFTQNNRQNLTRKKKERQRKKSRERDAKKISTKCQERYKYILFFLLNKKKFHYARSCNSSMFAKMLESNVISNGDCTRW